MSAATPLPYVCIFQCKPSFTSKTTLKRHLEQQHIARRAFQCKGCFEEFPTKPKAKSHRTRRDCRRPDLGFREITVERALFGCEFTGLCTTCREEYTDSLTCLCEMPLQDRPLPSYRRKLCALLEYPLYHQHLQDVSTRLLGRADAWKDLQWNEEDAMELADKLEHDQFCMFNDRTDSSMPRLKAFLYELITGHTLGTEICEQERLDLFDHNVLFSNDVAVQRPAFTDVHNLATSSSQRDLDSAHSPDNRGEDSRVFRDVGLENTSFAIAPDSDHSYSGVDVMSAHGYAAGSSFVAQGKRPLQDMDGCERSLKNINMSPCWDVQEGLLPVNRLGEVTRREQQSKYVGYPFPVDSDVRPTAAFHPPQVVPTNYQESFLDFNVDHDDG